MNTDITQAKEHLRARVSRLNHTWIRSWPRWNNADLVSVSLLLEAVDRLQARLDSNPDVAEVEVI